MKSARLLLPAESEMIGASRYYEAQAKGLGQDFLKRIEAAVADIIEATERWPVIQDEIRRRLILRFPYAIYYRDDPDEIVILAIAHLKRHPNYWVSRK